MLTTVPFSGFYNSFHDACLDDRLGSMFSDRETGCHPNKDLLDAAYGAVRWAHVHHQYAEDYCRAFAHEFGINLSFDSLVSPREYNFETDRIFATIDEDEVRRLFGEVDPDDLTAIAKERFTSCDGFISFYDPDWRAWGDVLEWDCNQVGTLLLAWLQKEDPDFDQYAELNLMENAHIEHWLSQGKEMERLLRIHDYLQERAERAA